MRDKITSKGIGQQTEKALFGDLAQFWQDRQSKLNDPESDRFNYLIEKLLNDIRMGMNTKEVYKNLKIIDEERIRMEAKSNSLFYQRGFQDGIRFILQTLIIE